MGREVGAQVARKAPGEGYRVAARRREAGGGHSAFGAARKNLSRHCEEGEARRGNPE
jgi:hypothetical protein